MGKYRTFSSKVFNFHGEPGVVNRNDEILNGDAPSDSSLRGKIERQNWNQGGPQLHQLHLLKSSSWLTLVFVGSLLCLVGPVSSSPPSFFIVDDDNTDLTGRLGVTNQSDSIFDGFFAPREARNCTPPSSDEFPQDLFSKEERQHGAIAIHFFVTFYMLYALLLVCDEYFVPAIECICQELKIPHNIAGATFMAVSTSAPELFTNVIGTFVTKGDLGVGTIVGSAVFNILAVGACVGIGTNFAVKNLPLGGSNPSQKRVKRKGVPLDWWSLTRDSMYYLVSIGALIVILLDGKVYWQEALVMLLIYCIYIAGMCYDSQCKAFAETLLGKMGKTFSSEQSSTRKISSVIKKVVTMDEEETAPLISHGSNDSCYGSQTVTWADVESNYKPIISNSKRVSLVDMLATSKEATYDSNSISSTDSNSSDSSTSSSVMVLGAVKDVISFPITFVQSWTIPDCKKESHKKWYGLALFSCVAWIGGLSYIISWMVCIIGATFNIPDSVSGLTFLAAGTSFPEVLSSVIVARQGFGSMGLSNSIGSNTFDILVCLGLPWLIQSAILTAQDVNYIEIHSGGIEYSAVLLITSLVLLYIMIAANGFALDMKVGVSCVLMYIIFITFACLLEMNVFFPVNLPPC